MGFPAASSARDVEVKAAWYGTIGDMVHGDFWALVMKVILNTQHQD
jgi:hypothetical protein